MKHSVKKTYFKKTVLWGNCKETVGFLGFGFFFSLSACYEVLGEEVLEGQ